MRFPRNYQWPAVHRQLEGERAHRRAASADDASRPRVDPTALGSVGYRKPAAVLLTLRNHVVGRAAFDQAFREYATAWAFKHPTPGDFFRSIESSTGEDLSWFWRGFFYTNDVLDIGIDSASTISRDGSSIAMIQLRKHTSIPFPVEMRLKLTDGSTVDLKLDVDIWYLGDSYTAAIPCAPLGRCPAVARRYRSRFQLVK